MTAQEKILDKLAKLKAHQESAEKIGNTNEAEAFATMINSMLLRHELSIEDIPTERKADDPIIEETVYATNHGMKHSRVRVGWQETLAAIVCDAHFCKLVVHRGSNTLTFIGTKSHVAVAEHAYGVLAGAADRMSIKARDEYWRLHRNEPDFDSGNYRAGWLTGFIMRIAERLREARAAEVAAAPMSSGQAMIRLNQALIRVQDYVKDNYKKKAAATTIRRGNGQSMRDGRRAADSINLGQKAVTSNSNKSKMIGG